MRAVVVGCKMLAEGRRAKRWKGVILHQVFFKVVLQSQIPRKSVTYPSLFTNIENKLTDLCGNWLLQNDFTNTV